MSMIQRAVNKRQGINLLSADGGIQGLAALVTLREFMRRIQAKLGLSTTPRPCEYFDLMAGTGIGGLIVIMLGRLRMTVDEAIEWFNEIVTLVFNSKKLWGNGAFKATIFEKIVERMVAIHTGRATAPMIDHQAGEGVCKTVVCAMSAHSMVGALPTLFRSYESAKNRAPDCTIVQAARATTARPGFFKPVEIVDHGIRLSYVDGGLGCNNPTARMLDEAELLFPCQHAQSIISLGTGQAHPSSVSSPSLIQRVLPTQATEAMERIATDCERTSQEIHTRFQHVPGVYFRFSVDQGLQDIQHSDFNKLPNVAAHAISNNQKTSVDLMLYQAVIATVEGTEMVATEQLNGAISVAMAKKRPKICPAPSVLFTGRQNVITQVEAYLFDGLPTRHVFVLHGLGGSGKTQIALRFVEKNRDRFSAVFYVDASSAATISADLGNIAKSKNVGGTEDDALAWFARHNESWLVVFNNADDTSLELRKYLPACSHGSILITTRNHQMINLTPGAHAHCKISGMLPQEAKDLLLKASDVQVTEVTESYGDMLAMEFGYLALAIIQAGAYIRVNGCTLEWYLDTYRKNKLLLEEYSKISPKIDDYEWTVHTTWLVSYRQLNPQVADFLNLLAFMHHDGISEYIFSYACQRPANATLVPIDKKEKEFYQSVRDLLKECVCTENGGYNKIAFLNVTRELRSYSLVDFDPFNQTYSIRPLVQYWSRATVPNSEATCCRTAVLLALSVHSDTEAQLPAFRQTVLLPHIDAVLSGAQSMSFIAGELGIVYQEAGRWQEAESLCAIERNRFWGTGPRSVLLGGEIMEKQYLIFFAQGRPKKSEVHIAYQEQKAVAEHSGRASSWGSLGVIVPPSSFLVGTRKLLLQVFGNNGIRGSDIEPNELGSLAIDHPDGSVSRDAVSQSRVARMIGEAPDPSDLRTLEDVESLTRIYLSKGKWEQAEELQWKNVQLVQKTFGSKATKTRNSIVAVARIYQTPQLLSELEYRVSRDESRLGRGEPSTLMSMHKLVLVYFNLDRLEDAERMGVVVLDTRRRVLRENDQDTLTSMRTLALIYQALGQEHKANTLYIEILRIKNRYWKSKCAEMLEGDGCPHQFNQPPPPSQGYPHQAFTPQPSPFPHQFNPTPPQTYFPQTYPPPFQSYPPEVYPSTHQFDLPPPHVYSSPPQQFYAPPPQFHTPSPYPRQT